MGIFREEQVELAGARVHPEGVYWDRGPDSRRHKRKEGRTAEPLARGLPSSEAYRNQLSRNYRSDMSNSELGQTVGNKAKRSTDSPVGLRAPTSQVTFWAIVTLVMCLAGRTEAAALDPPPGTQVDHTFDAFDCERPTAVSRSKLLTKCEEIVRTKGQREILPPVNFILAQSIDYFVYTASVCEQRRSSFTFQCAVWSHAILNEVPRFYRTYPTKLDECMLAITARRFAGPTGQIKRVELHGFVNYYSFISKGGVRIEKGYSYCEGEDGHVLGHNAHSVVKMEDVEFIHRKVTVREKFETGERQIVEDGIEIKCKEIGRASCRERV